MAASLIPPTDTDVPDMRKIPDWLLNHPELRKRGIILYKPVQPARIFILSVSVKRSPPHQFFYQVHCLSDPVGREGSYLYCESP